MRYVFACFACGAELSIYVGIGVFLEWRNGGGTIPMSVLVAILSATWVVITKSRRPNREQPKQERTQSRQTQAEYLSGLFDRLTSAAERQREGSGENTRMMLSADAIRAFQDSLARGKTFDEAADVAQEGIENWAKARSIALPRDYNWRTNCNFALRILVEARETVSKLPKEAVKDGREVIDGTAN